MQFLLGCLQFLVGGLQFFIYGLHFFVRGFQLFVGGFQFLIGGLEIFFLGLQFLFQRHDACISVCFGSDRKHLSGVIGVYLFQHHQIQQILCKSRTFCRNRKNCQVDYCEVPICFDVEARTVHGIFCLGCLVQGHGQVALQPFPGHLQDVVDPCFARSRFQIDAGSAMQVEDVALVVDKHANQGNLLQKRLFGQIAQREFFGKHRLSVDLGKCNAHGGHGRE